MITLYSGIPGSGKTYKMVNDLEEAKKKSFIIHNIEGLREGYLKENEGLNFIFYINEMKKNNPDFGIEDFFSKDYQIELTLAVRQKYGKNTIVIVDEAQEWFDRNKKTLKMWLSFHRHLNQDIWLVAHKATNIPSIYRSFIEVEYRAKTGSILCIPGFFMYNRISGGESLGYKFVRKKKEIFDIYKSTHEGFEKQRPSMLIPALLIMCVMGLVYFFMMPQRIIGKNVKNVDKKINNNLDVKIKEIENQQNFRYVGMIGGKHIIEDQTTKRNLTIEEMQGHKMFIASDDNYIKIYDLDDKKYLSIKSYNPQNVSIVDESSKVEKLK